MFLVIFGIDLSGNLIKNGTESRPGWRKLHNSCACCCSYALKWNAGKVYLKDPCHFFVSVVVVCCCCCCFCLFHVQFSHLLQTPALRQKTKQRNKA